METSKNFDVIKSPFLLKKQKEEEAAKLQVELQAEALKKRIEEEQAKLEYHKKLEYQSRSSQCQMKICPDKPIKN